MAYEPLPFQLEDLDSSFLNSGALAAGEPSYRREFRGTRALMLAVLEEGVRTYLFGAGRLRTDAELWINTARSEALFSFPVVCDMLGLDAEATRLALHRMRGESNPSLSRSRPNVSKTRRNSVG